MRNGKSFPGPSFFLPPNSIAYSRTHYIFSCVVKSIKEQGINGMAPHRGMWWCLLVIITGPSLAADAVERIGRGERYYNCCDRVGKGFSVVSSSPSALLFYHPPSALRRYPLDSCRCLCPRRGPFYISCFLRDGDQIKHCEHGERQEWS